MGLTELLGLDDLLAQFILAVGAAMVLGNGFALYKARKGERPKDSEGELRKGRAWWLLGAGLLIAFWGFASLLSQ